MSILILVALVLVYRWYLFYKKQNDLHAIAESQKMYLHEFYSQHFHFFKLLSTEEQEEFVVRALALRDRLEYNAVDDLMISENIKVLVSAAFTQITFGYDTFYLDNFNKIFLHPSVFFSRWVNRDVKGLTFAKGRIDWSWEDFVKGYMFNDDKVNLALHELAHALQIEVFDNKSIETPEYDIWLSLAMLEIKRMKNSSEPSFLRAYAATNIHEFFAVSVEYFFEAPVEFKETLPSLYHATAKVLNQDMALRVESNLLSGQSHY